MDIACIRPIVNRYINNLITVFVPMDTACIIVNRYITNLITVFSNGYCLRTVSSFSNKWTAPKVLRLINWEYSNCNRSLSKVNLLLYLALEQYRLERNSGYIFHVIGIKNYTSVLYTKFEGPMTQFYWTEKKINRFRFMG